MKPLISIETVPISIEYNVTRAPAKPAVQNSGSGNSQSAKLRVSRDNNQLTIRSNPIQIQMRDTFEQTNLRYIGYTATAEYSRNGTLSMDVQIQGGDPSAQGGAAKAPRTDYRFHTAGGGIDRMVDAVPRAAAPAPPLAGMRINFDMTRLSDGQDIGIDNVEASFIPPDLEISIVEYPKVIVKYVGGPIYFPRSADPNYEPPADMHTGSNFETKV
ncbi:MAG: hypothetical protein LBH39_06625 [Clostridiales Family XIII bacterium]|jgi:hypothetical protein|nr:hypothetical protein [Clostridiales Family XIII bacterium]